MFTHNSCQSLGTVDSFKRNKPQTAYMKKNLGTLTNVNAAVVFHNEAF